MRCWARPRTVSPRSRRISDLVSTDAWTDSLRTVAASMGSERVTTGSMVHDPATQSLLPDEGADSTSHPPPRGWIVVL